MDIINKTGIPTKNKGDGLSSSDVNKINSAVNQSVDVSNMYLKSVYDANLENGGTSRFYTFDEVVLLVPQNRRRIGLKIRFLMSSGFFEELVYVGDDMETTSWIDRNNWSHGGSIIDGGEF
jgi:hypothetical protein